MQDITINDYLRLQLRVSFLEAEVKDIKKALYHMEIIQVRAI